MGDKIGHKTFVSFSTIVRRQMEIYAQFFKFFFAKQQRSVSSAKKYMNIFFIFKCLGQMIQRWDSNTTSNQ